MAVTDTVVEQGIEAAFSKKELEARQDAARRALADRGIDVMIVTGAPWKQRSLTSRAMSGIVAAFSDQRLNSSFIVKCSSISPFTRAIRGHISCPA